MSNPNRNGPLVQAIITTFGSLVGGFFALVFLPSTSLRGPTLVDVIWIVSAVSVCVTSGAVLFSWASKR